MSVEKDFFFYFGICIIFLAFLTKIPQIVKILKAQSGAGITMVGSFLDLASYMFAFAYSTNIKHPFTSYGETSFLSIESAIVIALIFYYNQQHVELAAFLVLIVVVSILLLARILPPSVFLFLQGIGAVLAIGGKLAQVNTNYTNKHTGQLSWRTMYLLTFISTVRIFTSLFETHNMRIVANYTGVTVANLIIDGQLYFYGRNTSQFKIQDAFVVAERNSKSNTDSLKSVNKDDDPPSAESMQLASVEFRDRLEKESLAAFAAKRQFEAIPIAVDQLDTVVVDGREQRVVKDEFEEKRVNMKE